MKTKIYLLLALFGIQLLAHAAQPAVAPAPNAKTALQKLRQQSDNPKVSNESEWLMYASKTELIRRQSIRELKTLGDAGLVAVRRELPTATGEYRQMLTICLAALGDETAIEPTVALMLHAPKPAVRFVAATELRVLKNPRLIEPFKQALSFDGFKRRDGTCVNPGIIYPVKIIASGALVDLGMSLEEVRKIGRWREEEQPVRSAIKN